MFSKTRLAPTPSGYLHIGNIFSFLETQRVANETGAAILLRIDDMDRGRVKKPLLEDIFETLRYLGIAWKEGPANVNDFENHWTQRSRIERYHNILARLKQSNLVYGCNCPRSKILLDVEGGYSGTCRNKKLPLEGEVCWRLKTGNDPVNVKRYGQQPLEATLTPDMRDFVVRKKDGMPSYQLTSFADDLFFNVDLVVRGEDLWPSTLAQLYLAKLLGEDRFTGITFLHHRLLKDEQGRKLSKSAGHDSVKFLREQGTTREEIIRMSLSG